MKLNELKQLNESGASVKGFDATKMTIKDLEQAFVNAGMLGMGDSYTQSVYGGFDEKHKEHVFHMLFEDDTNTNEEGDATFAITTASVFLGKSGKIEADVPGMPSHEGMTKDEAVKKLASLKGKLKA